jgi:hypothetical protein
LQCGDPPFFGQPPRPALAAMRPPGSRAPRPRAAPRPCAAPRTRFLPPGALETSSPRPPSAPRRSGSAGRRSRRPRQRRFSSPSAATLAASHKAPPPASGLPASSRARPTERAGSASTVRSTHLATSPTTPRFPLTFPFLFIIYIEKECCCVAAHDELLPTCQGEPARKRKRCRSKFCGFPGCGTVAAFTAPSAPPSAPGARWCGKVGHGLTDKVPASAARHCGFPGCGTRAFLIFDEAPGKRWRSGHVTRRRRRVTKA